MKVFKMCNCFKLKNFTIVYISTVDYIFHQILLKTSLVTYSIQIYLKTNIDSLSRRWKHTYIHVLRTLWYYFVIFSFLTKLLATDGYICGSNDGTFLFPYKSFDSKFPRRGKYSCSPLIDALSRADVREMMTRGRRSPRWEYDRARGCRWAP